MKHFPVGLRQMQQRLKLVDCVIEVHDARVSFNVYLRLVKILCLGLDRTQDWYHKPKHLYFMMSCSSSS
jgi:hypothetical protein